jgi:hypothetical protein
MQAASSQIRPVKPAPSDRLSGLPSPALEWLWKYLGDVRRPRILHCGPVRWSTVEILLRRNAKLYLGDAISPLLNNNARFWDRSGKIPVFKLEDFWGEFPAIPPATLTVAFCWHLFDVLPAGLVPQVVEKLMSFIAPGGVLFCMLREPYLRAGVDAQWWMEDLKVIVATRLADRPFPNPVVTMREFEKVVPPGSLKVFLTRTGRREVVALK